MAKIQRRSLKMKPIVAIVGRSNVGKSTLFNRLIGSRRSVVENQPGVTRDRVVADSVISGRDVTLIDTGGMTFGDAGDDIEMQVRLAVKEADAIVALFDVVDGCLAADHQLVRFLKRSGKPAVYVVNKVDSEKRARNLVDFYELGVDFIPISAEHGIGIGDATETLLPMLPNASEQDALEVDESIRFAILGRPNVGKSTLVNSVLGYERVMVSADPGTTRDVIDTNFVRNGRRYQIIDTAGIRRRSRVETRIERYSGYASIRAIEHANLICLVLDAREGVTEQDQRILSLAIDRGRGVIIVMNKIDLVTKLELEQRLSDCRQTFAYAAFAPVLTLSALRRTGLEDLFRTISMVNQNWRRELTTTQLNQIVAAAYEAHPPKLGKNHRQIKLYFAAQQGSCPPKIIVKCNAPGQLPASYRRYLERAIRNAVALDGVPIRLRFTRDIKGQTP